MHLIYSLEDDSDISKIISISLTKAGYKVVSFETASSFMDAFNSSKPDMCLLDLMLPDASGFDVLKKIRSDENNKNIQIIIISARKMTIDKVQGLDLGADDYIEKPFDILELISRVNARFRRSEENKVFTYKDIVLDASSRTCLVASKEVKLTNYEFDILSLLVKEANKVVTREEIFKKVYDVDDSFETRTIDMHIASIRKKIGDEKGKMIHTVYGIGYLLG